MSDKATERPTWNEVVDALDGLWSELRDVGEGGDWSSAADIDPFDTAEAVLERARPHRKSPVNRDHLFDKVLDVLQHASEALFHDSGPMTNPQNREGWTSDIAFQAFQRIDAVLTKAQQAREAE